MEYLNKTIKFALTLTLALAAFAADAVYANYEQVGDRGISVSGITACKHGGEYFGVDVWAPSKSLADLRKESNKSKYSDILIFREQYVTGESGEYSFKFAMKDNDKNGFYRVVINCACGDETEEEVFYCNPEDNKKALEELREKTSAKEVYDFCMGKDENGVENKYRLGFVYDFDFDLYAAEILFNYVKSSDFNAEDKSGAISAYKKSIILSQIHGGNISNIFDYADELGIHDTRIEKFVKDNAVTDKIKTNLTKRLSEKTVKSFGGFIDELYEQFVLASVQYSNGYSDIGDIVEEFKTEVGVSARPSDKACLVVMNKNYSDYGELCKVLKDADSDRSQTGGSSSGSSGGSGGGKGGSMGSNGFSQDYVTNDNKTKIDKNIFSDLESVPWATDAIVELAENDIINGKEPEKFYPNDTITREEAAKLLALAFLKDSPESEVEFDDVDNSAWYAAYIKICSGCGVFNGIGDNLFGTGMQISREDMAVIAYRTAVYCGLLAEDTENRGFKFGDDESIADYAKTAIYALENKKIINGVGNNMFAPKLNLTRAEAAKIIYELYTINK